MNIQEAHPDDAVNIAGHLHTVLYEDDKMRVLKVIVRPGDEAAMHWHPHNMNYVLSGGKLMFTKPDGTSAEVELAAGQVTSSDQESSHGVKNTGDTTVETVQVELKY